MNRQRNIKDSIRVLCKPIIIYVFVQAEEVCGLKLILMAFCSCWGGGSARKFFYGSVGDLYLNSYVRSGFELFEVINSKVLSSYKEN